MDSLASSSAAANLDFSKLSDKDKHELQQFVVNESQKARIQQTIHSTTDMCFRKCVTSKITSAALDRYEEPCMTNCVDRFMDANKIIYRELEKMKGIQ